jgi:hypothetical protein
MSKIRRSEDFTAWGMQWAARIISTVFALFLAFMALGSFLHDEHKVDDSEDWMGFVIGFFVLAYLAAVLIAWFKEKTGGTLLFFLGLLAVIGFMVTEKPEDYLITLIIGFPFLVSGFLYWLCAKRIGQKRT